MAPLQIFRFFRINQLFFTPKDTTLRRTTSYDVLNDRQARL